jgi:cobalt-zinc-cadmium efflux system protein
VLVLAITLTVVGAELVGGLLSGSLALLADAGHMLTDATGVMIALVASTLAGRPATNTRTFGWLRAEILGALANGLLLAGLGLWVIVQAIDRWDDPPGVSTGLMLGVAVGGGLANLASLFILRGAQKESLNVRGAYIEILGDLIGSIAVITAALVIATTGYLRADVLASIGIGLFILPRAWTLLREVLDILLEATPRYISLDEVRTHILGVAGVLDVHDLHVWTITSGVPALSAHVVVNDEYLDGGQSEIALAALSVCLGEHFATEHCTFQLERAEYGAREAGLHA